MEGIQPAAICVPGTPACLPDPVAGVGAAFATFLTGLETWLTTQWNTLWTYVGAHTLGWIGAGMDALATAIGAGIAQLATALIVVVTTTPTFLDPGSGLLGLYTSFWTFAFTIAGALFLIEMVRGLALSWGMPIGGVGYGLRRGAGGLLALQALNPQTGLLNTWVGIVNGLAGAVSSGTGGGATTLATALSGYVDFALKAAAPTAGLGLVLGMTLIGAISLVILLLCAIIVLQRLGGLFVLGGLMVVAPLCAVALISTEFRPFGRWWFVNFVSYSLWGFGYAVVLSVIGAVLVVGGPTTTTMEGAMGSDLLYHVALPLAGLLVLLRVPRLMDGMLGAMGSGTVGATALFDAGASVARTYGARMVRGMP